MRKMEVAFILCQVKKGMPKEKLLEEAVSVPDTLCKKDCVVIHGYQISLWMIHSIYEAPELYEITFKAYNLLPKETVINEDWLNNSRP